MSLTIKGTGVGHGIRDLCIAEIVTDGSPDAVFQIDICNQLAVDGIVTAIDLSCEPIQLGCIFDFIKTLNIRRTTIAAGRADPIGIDMLTDQSAADTVVSRPAVTGMVYQIFVRGSRADRTGVNSITIFDAGRRNSLPCLIAMVDLGQCSVVAIGTSGAFGDLLTRRSTSRLDDLSYISVMRRINIFISGSTAESTGIGKSTRNPAAFLFRDLSFIPDVYRAGLRCSADRTFSVLEAVSCCRKNFFSDLLAEGAGIDEQTVNGTGSLIGQRTIVPSVLACIELRPAAISIGIAVFTVSRHLQIIRLLTASIVKNHIFH